MHSHDPGKLAIECQGHSSHTVAHRCLLVMLGVFQGHLAAETLDDARNATTQMLLLLLPAAPRDVHTASTLVVAQRLASSILRARGSTCYVATGPTISKVDGILAITPLAMQTFCKQFVETSVLL